MRTAVDTHLEEELIWLLNVLEWRLKTDFLVDSEEEKILDWKDIARPSFENEESTYKVLVDHYDLNLEQRLILILALVTIYIPGDFVKILTEEEEYRLADTACIRMSNEVIKPTGGTAVYLLAGKHGIKNKTEAFCLLMEHPLILEGILSYNSISEGLSFEGPLVIKEELILFLGGKIKLENIIKPK